MITKEGKHHILPSDITEKQSEKSAEHSLVFVIVHLMKLWATKWIAWEYTLFLGVLLLGLEVRSGGGGGGGGLGNEGQLPISITTTPFLRGSNTETVLRACSKEETTQ